MWVINFWVINDFGELSTELACLLNSHLSMTMAANFQSATTLSSSSFTFSRLVMNLTWFFVLIKPSLCVEHFSPPHLFEDTLQLPIIGRAGCIEDRGGAWMSKVGGRMLKMGSCWSRGQSTTVGAWNWENITPLPPSPNLEIIWCPSII